MNNDKGYILLEVLLLVAILLIIIRIFIPNVSSLNNFIKINRIRDDKNIIQSNIVESIKMSIKNNEDINIYGIDISTIIDDSFKISNFIREYDLEINNNNYYISIEKDDINEELWKYYIIVKENGYEEDPIRIIVQNPK